MTITQLLAEKFKKHRAAIAGAGLALLVCGGMLVALKPVLFNPRYCILDAPVFCDLAQHVRLNNLSTYLNLEQFNNRAQYGYLLYMFPNYFTLNPLWRAWTHSGLLLAIACWCIYRLLRHAGSSRWIAALGVPVALFTPSFTENYYTLYKAEPWMLTGALAMTLLLHWRLAHERRTLGLLPGTLFYTAALLAGLLIYSVKETGAAYFGVFLCGTALIAWGRGTRAGEALRKTWPLLVLNALLLAIEIYRFATLPTRYSVGGQAAYSLAPASVIAGLARVAAHFIDTAVYVLPALLIISAGFHVYLLGQLDEPLRAKLRVKLAWILVFLALFAGMAAILVPWPRLDERYFLVAATGAALATILAVELGLFLVRLRMRPVAHTLLLNVTILTAALLLAHATYSAIVGPFSEGRARIVLDTAYDDMFRYLADNVPSNGTAYFMMRHDFSEPMQNTVLGLRLFYHRPDIHCEFPLTQNDFVAPGLLAVSHIEDFHFNYKRMPVHSMMSALFYGWNPDRATFVHVTNMVCSTPVAYALEEYNAMQYRTEFGIPALWALKHGNYTFGWSIYEVAGNAEKMQAKSSVVKRAPQGRNLVLNSSFTNGLAHWSLFRDAKQAPETVSVIAVSDTKGITHAVRINNPAAKNVGVQQVVRVTAGRPYRLIGTVHSPRYSFEMSKVFGGRIVLYVPGQDEQELLWGLNEYAQWTEKWIVFTNRVAGIATVYASLGYGKVSAVGEFTDIRLEEVTGDR